MDTTTSESPLAITIQLHAARPPAGEVVLTNTSDGSIRLWRTGNTWGDSALSFIVRVDDANVRLVQRLGSYTRNVPASLVVPPGGEHRLAFDLGDGSWEADASLDRLWRDAAWLIAVYEVEETPESTQLGVWTGRVVSAPVPLTGATA